MNFVTTLETRKPKSHPRKIQYKIIKANSVKTNSKLERFLWNCSYKDNGLLYDTYESEKNKTDSYVLYCLVDGKYAGWAFTHKAYEHYPDVMLYVYKKYRRNKIGTNLFKLAKKVHKVENIDYTRHDKISRAFFNSVD